MRRPGTGRRTPGGLGDLLRLVVAAGLLGTVAIVTVDGVSTASTTVEQRRLQDRTGLARAFAGSLTEWLAAAQGAAARLAGGADPAQLSGWETLRVDRNGRLTGTSGRYQSLFGSAVSHPCPAGVGLRDLVDAASKASSPVVMVLAPPGSCDPVIGAAAPTASGTAVVTGDIGSLLAQVAVASHLQGGARTFVIDPAGNLLSSGRPPTTVPSYLVSFVKRVSSGTGASARYPVGDPQHTQVVGAGAPVTAGWSVIVEQNAAGFDVGPVTRPSRVAVVVLGAAFAAVLLLQALSDARRRRATRRADAHRAAFLAVLSHELRTPLTVIKGFVDTLSSRWTSLGEAQRHELVDRLPPQTRRLNRVVERLLLAANMQAGSHQRPALTSVAVRSALERIVDGFAPIAPLHEFVVDAEPDLTARAGTKALDQILDQLVDNAVRYSPSGGTVRVGAIRRRGRIEIFVEDEGVGLPSDTRGIFDAFVQGESVDGRVHDEGGVGVGLYIVRTLCDQLGGSVRAERRSPRGARVVVALRASDDRVAARV